jgi:hypothetical protein
MATVTNSSQLAQPMPQPRLLPASNSDFYPMAEVLYDSPPEYSTPCPTDRFEAWRNRAIVRTIP